MEGLPFLPGNSFTDPTSTRFHRSQTLGYRNGYTIPTRPTVGIGGHAIPYNQLSEQELDDLANYRPSLTYGQAKQAPPEDFIPGHVAWDKKVLKFSAWFKQTVHESPLEHFRVRHVHIYYYLEDDSIAVIEPEVQNSGMPQGKLINRQRIPKNDVGDHWTWKDLNNGVNVVFYGKVFHIFDLDKWTRDYLDSEGIVVNPIDSAPSDPYIERRKKAAELKKYKTQSDFDKLRQFKEMDGKVLRFYCVWDDRDNMFGEMRKFIIHYFLVDDSIEIREVHQANNGHDPFPVLISRQKIPKDRYEIQSTFPSVVMELTEQEIHEYFTPKDFMVGQTVIIYNRKFFIYEMDNFTKAFYWKNFGITDFTPQNVEPKKTPAAKMEIPIYNGFGSMEDSMQSCLSLIPQPPKKDFIKMLENDGRVLRFEAVMDSVHPEDEGRRFILFFRLSDDMITIYEPPVRNSGIIGGKFLERTRVAKPHSDPNKAEFYGPQDFYMGAIVEVFKHRFRIINADHYVLKFMETRKDQIPESTIQSLRDKLGNVKLRGGPYSSQGHQTERIYDEAELCELVREVRGQLKKIAITSNNRKDRIFLEIDMDRQGFISKANLHEMCLKQHLPADPQIIDKLAEHISPNNPEQMCLEDIRAFLESA